MISSRKAFELSVNFLVVIILSVTLLSLGIYFVKTMYESSKDIQSALDKQTEEQIESLLDQGYSFAIPINTRYIQSGGSALFGVGILNSYNLKQEFQLNIKFSDAFDKDKARITNAEQYFSVLYDDKAFNLEPDENKKISVKMQTKKGIPSGTYIFDAEASPYTELNRISVVVE